MEGASISVNGAEPRYSNEKAVAVGTGQGSLDFKTRRSILYFINPMKYAERAQKEQRESLERDRRKPPPPRDQIKKLTQKDKE